MHEAFSRRGAVLAATGFFGATGALGAPFMLAGCNTFIGLDDVTLSGSGTASSGGGNGTGGTTGTSTGGAGGTMSSGGGGETTSSSGTTGSGATGGTTGSGGTGGGTTGSGGTGGTPCLGDADCTPPLVCDAPSGDCVQPTCGDGKKDGTETGPDCGGPMCPPCGDGLGCLKPIDCLSGVCAGTCQSPKCGDGVLNGADACDDGGAVSGDGCSAACAVEPGWTCTGMPLSVCKTTCGDGVVLGGELCDDGNTAADDGCSPGCLVEAYHQCTDAPSVCVAQETRCQDGADGDGDGLIDAMDPDCDLPLYMAQLGCGTTRVYRSVEVPLDVPDNQQAGVFSRIVVPESVGVGHMSVILDIAHPRDSDVVVTLFPPFGPPRTLANGNGGSGADFVDTVFDSACALPVSLGAAPFSSCYKPVSVFPGSGQQAQGVWWLQVQDEASGQTGTLLDWTLVICGQ